MVVAVQAHGEKDIAPKDDTDKPYSSLIGVTTVNSHHVAGEQVRLAGVGGIACHMFVLGAFFACISDQDM